MHWTLLLLLFTNACLLSLGQVRHAYHYFEDRKTWSEAKEFCREHYTGLALVNDNASSVCRREQGCKDAWVRQDYGQQENADWQWTSSDNDYDESKATWRDDTHDTAGDCAFVEYHDHNQVSFHSQSCGTKSRFICFSDRQSQNRYEPQTEPKTWCEARRVCQDNEGDLVTGHEHVTNEDFIATVQNMGSDIACWIGLFKSDEPMVDRFCRCTKITGNKLQPVRDCDLRNPYICYDDHMVLVQEKKNFEEALIHCRTHYGELATITNEHQQRMVQARVDQALTDYTWIGLAYACFFEEWLWVTGSWVSAHHQNWGNPNILHGCDIAGAMSRLVPNKWFKVSFEERLNFVCTVGWSCCQKKQS